MNAERTLSKTRISKTIELHTRQPRKKKSDAENCRWEH